jgi:glycerol-3-phosphate dehydrogenase
MVERAGREAECKTADIPLGMAAEESDLEPPEELPETDLPEGHRELLRFRYGHAARNVLRIAAERPELRQPIVDGEPDLLAEVALAARLEQATSVADVLLRRTRLGLLAAPKLRGAEQVMPVAEVLGAELGWDEHEIAQAAEKWTEDAENEGIDPAIGVPSTQ